MELFYSTFGVVAAICAGVAILAIFFSVLSRVMRAVSSSDIRVVRGFVKDERLINVHFTHGEMASAVKFIGFTDASSAKSGRIPYHFSGMLVCETVTGARRFIRADKIQMIEEIESPI